MKTKLTIIGCIILSIICAGAAGQVAKSVEVHGLDTPLSSQLLIYLLPAAGALGGFLALWKVHVGNLAIHMDAEATKKALCDEVHRNDSDAIGQLVSHFGNMDTALTMIAMAVHVPYDPKTTAGKYIKEALAEAAAQHAEADVQG